MPLHNHVSLHHAFDDILSAARVRGADPLQEWTLTYEHHPVVIKDQRHSKHQVVFRWRWKDEEWHEWNEKRFGYHHRTTCERLIGLVKTRLIEQPTTTILRDSRFYPLVISLSEQAQYGWCRQMPAHIARWSHIANDPHRLAQQRPHCLRKERYRQRKTDSPAEPVTFHVPMIPASTLQAMLKSVSKTVATCRRGIPDYHLCQLQIRDNHLHLVTTTGYEVSLSLNYLLAGDCPDSEYFVDYVTLCDVIALANSPLELIGTPSRLTIQNKEAQYRCWITRLKAGYSEIFPTIPTQWHEAGRVDAATCYDAWTTLLKHTPKGKQKENSPELCVLALRVDQTRKEALSLVATDGYRMAEYHFESDSEPAIQLLNQTFVFPAVPITNMKLPRHETGEYVFAIDHEKEMLRITSTYDGSSRIIGLHVKASFPSNNYFSDTLDADASAMIPDPDKFSKKLKQVLKKLKAANKKDTTALLGFDIAGQALTFSVPRIGPTPTFEDQVPVVFESNYQNTAPDRNIVISMNTEHLANLPPCDQWLPFLDKKAEKGYRVSGQLQAIRIEPTCTARFIIQGTGERLQT
jgi:hypothetical protein